MARRRQYAKALLWILVTEPGMLTWTMPVPWKARMPISATEPGMST